MKAKAAGFTVGKTNSTLPKSPTGIQGLDEITGGGLPKGRPTLIAGAAGCGKTLLGMEFLVRGATEFGEPGVFMAFEETGKELVANVRSLGFDLNKLVAQKKIALDHVRVERSEIEETGEYDLEGLFIRLEHAVKSVGAKRVVLDTVETLFAGLPNQLIIRAELRRLFAWLKERGLTAIITGERGGAEGTLTRHGLEEYVADCVIVLDHRVDEQMSTRRLRVVKYRGSMHGTNEYPFLIGEHGISVMPVTSMKLDHEVTSQRISSGIARLDEMLGGKGFYRGSSVLVSGSPGCGKTSVAAHFADATCRRGERCLMFAYEESPSQVLRNMRSIGIDLEQWVRKGLLQIHATRPTLYGLEMHLVTMHDLVVKFRPTVVIVDPISNLTVRNDETELKPTLMRLIDSLKTRHVTALFTSLTTGGSSLEESQVGVSSLMDTWLLLRNMENNGEKTRTFYILKSRGMAHSNQVREFVMTGKGVDLLDVYVGANAVLTGTARVAQEGRERAEAALRQREHTRKLRQLSRKRKAIEAQIAALQADVEAEEDEIKSSVSEDSLQQKAVAADRRQMTQLRGGAR
ncbi:MAG: circadian clock protein KaiC [Verrucomicrobia bacterium]|nr:circadian clock protein KaiC [Verrucomicrobiota bacterium]